MTSDDVWKLLLYIFKIIAAEIFIFAAQMFDSNSVRFEENGGTKFTQFENVHKREEDEQRKRRRNSQEIWQEEEEETGRKGGRAGGAVSPVSGRHVASLS